MTTPSTGFCTHAPPPHTPPSTPPLPPHTLLPLRQPDGTVVHVQLSERECEVYCGRVESVVRECRERMAWLKSGSRELFGTILEDKVGATLPRCQSTARHIPPSFLPPPLSPGCAGNQHIFLHGSEAGPGQTQAPPTHAGKLSETHEFVVEVMPWARVHVC